MHIEFIINTNAQTRTVTTALRAFGMQTAKHFSLQVFQFATVQKAERVMLEATVRYTFGTSIASFAWTVRTVSSAGHQQQKSSENRGFGRKRAAARLPVPVVVLGCCAII